MNQETSDWLLLAQRHIRHDSQIEPAPAAATIAVALALMPCLQNPVNTGTHGHRTQTDDYRRNRLRPIAILIIVEIIRTGDNGRSPGYHPEKAAEIARLQHIP